MSNGRGVVAAVFGAMAFALTAGPVAAESMNAALGSAYINNPDLNSARAQLRAIDEGVPKALSGYRPQIIRLRRHRDQDDPASYPSDRLCPGKHSDWSTGSDAPRRAAFGRAADLPRLPHHQQRQAGAELGQGGARAAQGGRVERAARRGHRLHGRDPRPGRGQSHRAEHRVPARAASRRRGPAERRRGHQDRRCADQCPPAGGHLRLRPGRRRPQPGDRHLHPGDRSPAGEPRRVQRHREAPAADHGRRSGGGVERSSVDRRRRSTTSTSLPTTSGSPRARPCRRSASRDP